MPFKSDAQRRWAHTKKGEEALGGPKAVNEWDEASKGKELPEKVKKMCDGGMAYSEGGEIKPKSVLERMYADGGEFADPNNVEQHMDQDARTKRELGIEPHNGKDSILQQIPLLGLINGLNRNQEVKDALNNPELLAGKSGPGWQLDTNVNRNADWKDKEGNTNPFHDKDTEFMSDGGEIGDNLKQIEESKLGLLNNSPTAGVDGVIKNPNPPKEEREEETAGENGLLEHFKKNYADGGMVNSVVPEVQLPDETKKKGEYAPGYADGDDGTFAAATGDEGPGPNEDVQDLEAPIENPLSKIINSPIGKVADFASNPIYNTAHALAPIAGKAINPAITGYNKLTGMNVPTLPDNINQTPFGGGETGGKGATGTWNPPVNPPPNGGAKPASTPVPNTDNQMNDYFAKQEGLLNKYGPEKQAAANTQLNKSEYSPLSAIDKAIGGFSDAIMQGVARAGKGDTLQNIQAGWNGLRQNIVGAMKDMNQQEQEAVKAHIGMLDKDPTTGYAQGIQAAASHLIGDTTGKAFAGFPPGMITDIMKNAVDSQDARARLEELRQYHVADIQQKQIAARAGAAETLAKNKPAGPISRVLGGQLYPSSKMIQTGYKTAENIAKGGTGIQPITATNSMGHKIQSTDGGKTWTPVQ